MTSGQKGESYHCCSLTGYPGNNTTMLPRWSGTHCELWKSIILFLIVANGKANGNLSLAGPFPVTFPVTSYDLDCSGLLGYMHNCQGQHRRTFLKMCEDMRRTGDWQDNVCVQLQGLHSVCPLPARLQQMSSCRFDDRLLFMPRDGRSNHGTTEEYPYNPEIYPKEAFKPENCGLLLDEPPDCPNVDFDDVINMCVYSYRTAAEQKHTATCRILQELNNVCPLPRSWSERTGCEFTQDAIARS